MADKWWYRTLGQEFGPVELSTLQSLFDDGVLDTNDDVRLCESSPWKPIREVSEISGILPNTTSHQSPKNADLDVSSREAPNPLPSGLEPVLPPATENPPQVPTTLNTEPVESLGPALQDRTLVVHSVSIQQATQECLKNLNAKQRKQTRHKPRRRVATGSILVTVFTRLAVLLKYCQGFLEAFAQLLPKRSLMLATLSVAVVYLGFRVYAFIPWERYPDETAHQELTGIVNELQSLRATNAGDQEWESYVLRSEATGMAIAEELRGRASVDQPVSLWLLRATRDYLPIMLRDSRKAESTSERQFMLHLQRADMRLAQKQNQQGSIGTLAWALTGVNIALCLALLAYFRSTNDRGDGRE